MIKKKQPSSSGGGGGSIGCWIFFILLFGAFIALIVVLATAPYPATSFYRKSYARKNCTIGEEYDTDLDLCSPITNWPIPINHELMDLTVKPCDSFFHHMSGKWIQSHSNENRAFSYIFQKNQKQIHDIITSPKSGPIYYFYRSCVDTLVHKQHISLDKSQVRHVREHILGAFNGYADLPIVFARLASYDFITPFTFTIEAHPTKFRMIPLIQRGEVKLPSTAISPLLLPFFQRLESFATDLPITDHFIDYVQSKRYPKDLIKMGALLDVSPRDFWKLYLRELNGYKMEEDINVANQELWVPDRQFMRAFLQGLQSFTLEEWKLFIEYSIDEGTRDFFPELSDDSYFRIHNPIRRTKRSGNLNLGPAQIQISNCISLTHRLIPSAIGNLYLLKNQINRDQVIQIAENVRTSLASLVNETPWLLESTRHDLVKKIKSIVIRAVTPNFFEQEPFLERLTIDNYLRNLNIVRRYMSTRNFELWTNGEPNRDFIQRFGVSTAETNAFYSPITNTITVFAGILSQPFYDKRFANVALYSIVGMVIGHEIAHSIDNSGRLFNSEGSLYRAEPWNSAEVAEFQNQTNCLMEEYSVPFGCNIAEYGRQTIGEDMSDVIGLRAAYNAWVKSESNLPTKQQKQWFFQIFAQAWAEVYDMDMLCKHASTDVHGIAHFRVDITLRQMKEFRDVFGCKITDKMTNENSCLIYGV